MAQVAMSAPEIHIERIDEGRARYVARISGSDAEAELTVRQIEPELLIADHIDIPAEWRGRGVAHALVERLVVDARASSMRVTPISETVWAEAVRNIGWSDVVRCWTTEDIR